MPGSACAANGFGDLDADSWHRMALLIDHAARDGRLRNQLDVQPRRCQWRIDMERDGVEFEKAGGLDGGGVLAGRETVQAEVS